jgi:amyloid beta precursor protein binding protein 1
MSVLRFCLNAGGVRIQSQNVNRTLNDIWNENQPGEDDILNILVIFDGILAFLKENYRFPGDCNETELKDDEKEVKNICGKICRELDAEPNIKKGWIEEIVRTGGIEIHTVASYIGGLAAQEIIKVIKLLTLYCSIRTICFF